MTQPTNIDEELRTTFSKDFSVELAESTKNIDYSTWNIHFESYTDSLENMYKNILIDGLPTKALIDTGSTFTRIRSDCAKNLLLNPKFVSTNTTEVEKSNNIIGEVTVDIEIDDIIFTNVQSWIVSSRNQIEPEVIIGQDILSAAHVIITPAGITFQPTNSMKPSNGEDSALPITYIQDLKIHHESPSHEATSGLDKSNSKCIPLENYAKISDKQSISHNTFTLQQMTKFITIDNLIIDAFIDTGASVSLIADKYLAFLPNGYEIHPFRLFINNSIISNGYIIVTLEIDEIIFDNVILFVLSAKLLKDKVIIGADVINKAKVIINSGGIRFRTLLVDDLDKDF